MGHGEGLSGLELPMADKLRLQSGSAICLLYERTLGLSSYAMHASLQNKDAVETLQGC